MYDEINNGSNLENGKCNDCNACGHSGCCPPTECKMLFSSPFCKRYLIELKATYTAYSKMYSLVYKNQNSSPDLFKKVNDINNELTD